MAAANVSAAYAGSALQLAVGLAFSRGPAVWVLCQDTSSTGEEAISTTLIQVMHQQSAKNPPACLICEEFNGEHNVQVVLVGNGPLSVSQRKDIAKADCIVRFNQLNNR